LRDYDLCVPRHSPEDARDLTSALDQTPRFLRSFPPHSTRDGFGFRDALDEDRKVIRERETESSIALVLKPRNASFCLEHDCIPSFSFQKRN